MLLKHKLLSFAVVVLFVAGACNLSAPAGGSAEATLEALSVQSTIDAAIRLTAEAGGSGGGESSGGGETSAPTETLAPTNTSEPTLTPSPSVPIVEVSVATNCRRGDGVVFEQIGALLVGETAEILGRRADNQYFLIRNPDGGPDCWLWAEYATVSGNLNALPVLTPPPTPTPTYTPTPVQWFVGSWNTILDGNTYTMEISQTGNTISSTIVSGPNTITINGTVSGPEYKHVTGTWEAMPSGYSGTFEWQLRVNTNQFVGTGIRTSPSSYTADWCGYRSGASVPSPCGLP